MPSLNHIRIFAGISDQEMQAVTPKLQPFSIQTDEILFYHGDKASTLYIIDEGEVSVYANVSGNKNICLSKLRAGSIIGEMSLLSPTTRSATIQADKPTRGWSLSCDAFDLLCRQQSPAALQMLKNVSLLLSERLRAMPLYSSETPPADDLPAWHFTGEATTPDQKYNDFLQRLSFFTDFQPQEITTIMNSMKQWHIPRGELLFEDGAPGHSAYLVLRGAVEESIIKDGQKQQLSIIGPGKTFGLLSLIDNKPRYANYMTRERCILLEMSAESFHKLFNQGDQLAFRFLQAIDLTLSEALRQASQQYRTQIIITDLLSHH